MFIGIFLKLLGKSIIQLGLQITVSSQEINNPHLYIFVSLSHSKDVLFSSKALPVRDMH